MLALQRSIGNRAVGRALLARSPKDPEISEWPSKDATLAEARKAAEALEDAARAKGPAFVPSWVVELSTQLGWKSIKLAKMTDTELSLLIDVMEAPEVIVGRSVNVQGRGMLVLDDWLSSRTIAWTQRWQDVYNKSLYMRTASGMPVDVMAGAGYSAAEAAAAEEGAALAGIKNRPYWPDAAPPGPPVTGAAVAQEASAAGVASAGASAGASARAAAAQFRLGVLLVARAALGAAVLWWLASKLADAERRRLDEMFKAKVDPKVQKHLANHAAEARRLALQDPLQPVYAVVNVDMRYSGFIAPTGVSETILDVSFVSVEGLSRERIHRERTLTANSPFNARTAGYGQPIDGVRRVTYSVELAFEDPKGDLFRYRRAVMDERTAKQEADAGRPARRYAERGGEPPPLTAREQKQATDPWSNRAARMEWEKTDKIRWVRAYIRYTAGRKQLAALHADAIRYLDELEGRRARETPQPMDRFGRYRDPAEEKALKQWLEK
jgi:hypothetical protein